MCAPTSNATFRPRTRMSCSTRCVRLPKNHRKKLITKSENPGQGWEAGVFFLGRGSAKKERGFYSFNAFAYIKAQSVPIYFFKDIFAVSLTKLIFYSGDSATACFCTSKNVSKNYPVMIPPGYYLPDPDHEKKSV